MPRAAKELVKDVMLSVPCQRGKSKQMGMVLNNSLPRLLGMLKVQSNAQRRHQAWELMIL